MKILENVNFAKLTTIKTGGKIPKVIFCEQLEELKMLQKKLGYIKILGSGSNIIPPDSDIDFPIVKLTGIFNSYSITPIGTDKFRVVAGGGTYISKIATTAAKNGIGGLEPFATFPASTGGAVFMNAGCYGTEIKDLLEWVEFLIESGETVRLEVDNLSFSYRKSIFHTKSYPIVKACFKVYKDPKAYEKINIYKMYRNNTKAYSQGPSAGSIFKNPSKDLSAGYLLDSCNLRGFKIGGAKIAEEHCNVIINTGDAKAKDIILLMQEMWRRVYERFGIKLEPEVELLGINKDIWKAFVQDEGKYSYSCI